MNGFIMRNGNFLESVPDGQTVDTLYGYGCLSVITTQTYFDAMGKSITWHQYNLLRNRCLENRFHLMLWLWDLEFCRIFKYEELVYMDTFARLNERLK